jgi:hypothetical protein
LKFCAFIIPHRTGPECIEKPETGRAGPSIKGSATLAKPPPSATGWTIGLAARQDEVAPRQCGIAPIDESPRTTKLYDRRKDEISLEEVERIAI